MLRIAVIILVLVIILVAVYLPQFRRALGIILIILAGAIGIIIWADTQERHKEFQRMQPSQAQLSHMAVRPGLNSRSFVVSGRMENLATDYTILSVKLQATVKDCVQATCGIVGQEHRIFQLNIPSKQARDFSVTIPFSTTPKFVGEPLWEYDILQIQAR